MVKIFNRKRFTPQDLADQAQRILSGECGKWDVDDYENYRPKGPKLQDLHSQTLRFGLPEQWGRLANAQKEMLQAIIDQIRKIEVDG